ncbi:type II toxin-antitoxin system RelE/ParE family toxin [Streptomyces murinus]|uniref:type II toxin-antitoxin system RelE/ParE family toxin n=1 Tax=Streptomyces murinus TaxID=33900 RepID=UPI00382AA1A3
MVRDAVELLADQGPTLGRPAVDRIHGSQLHNLKELRPGSSGRSEIRILFKAGNWDGWYRDAIKLAEERYERYLETPSEEIE